MPATVNAYLDLFRARFDEWTATFTDQAADLASELSRQAELIFTGSELASGSVHVAVGASVALLALIGALALLRRRTPKAPAPAVSLLHHVRGPRRLGWMTIGLVFFISGGLAATIPLSSAAIAPGVVSPDGSRKTIQHLEGGIVRYIHVREGDAVVQGQPLVTLQDVHAQAQLAELRERLVYLVATEARLLAEQSGAAVFEVPAVPELADSSLLKRAIASQQILLNGRRETRTLRDRLLSRRIQQLREQNTGLHEVVAAQDEEGELLGSDIASAKTLVDKGYEHVSRLRELQRTRAELKGERARNLAQVASNDQEISAAEIELRTTNQGEREKVDAELAAVQAELGTLRTKLPTQLDILDRTVVTAAMNGTVMNVRVTTETGVVMPGAPLLDIVPLDVKLVVDARVQPTDIDVVHPGMRAKVVLSAYAQRNLPQVHGILRSISADSLTDERTGEQYFLAKVEIDQDDLSAFGGRLELIPGMPAEVFILTGERTALDYLVRPLVESVTKSFRET
jgi:HlyD family type I secretion membrane fusion protein